MQLVNSRKLVTKPHSGIIVLMLSYLLPIRWQCHTVVSDHPIYSISNNTNSYNNNTHIVQELYDFSRNKLQQCARVVPICEHSRAEVEIQLERWRETFEAHGLRVSRGKTEYMPCPERAQAIYIQEKEVKTVKTFKYLGSMFDANGGAEKDVNNRVMIAWSK